MNNTKISVRMFKDKLWKIVIIFISLLSTIPLLFIIFYLVKNGISSLSLQFLIYLPKPLGETGGGVSNAIVGTFLLILLSSLFSIPLGIFAGIYLSEYRDTRLAYTVRLCVDLLNGVPSIVIGIFAWLILVVPMKRFSALSGGFALGIIMLPLIVRSTEETLKLMPPELKEASLALGVSYSRTILKVVVRSGLSSIITGIIVSIARISGETAPILFTAFGNPFMNINILKPISSLPLIIYNYATSPYQEWHKLAWGASFVLMMFVLLLNFISKLVTRK
jgi:phosphate transport system permease protein